jgi:hypothetical protein
MPQRKTGTPEDWQQRCTVYPPELIVAAERYGATLFPPVDFDYVVRQALAQMLGWSPTLAKINPPEPTASE